MEHAVAGQALPAAVCVAHCISDVLSPCAVSACLLLQSLKKGRSGRGVLITQAARNSGSEQRVYGRRLMPHLAEFVSGNLRQTLEPIFDAVSRVVALLLCLRTLKVADIIELVSHRLPVPST